MKAAWYEAFGSAKDVLTIGEMTDPAPAPGEVLVRIKASGINPSDVKLRSGARPGAVMAYPQIIPHSDGAGVIEAVGDGVDAARIGERVWLWNAQWRRAFGTAAEFCALPSEQAVLLPDAASFEAGALMGIPGMTAWHALFADGPVEGRTILVTGGAGAVGRYAIQMAELGGARVITTVSSSAKGAHSGAADWINYRDTNVAEAVMEMTGGAGVDRIVEVDFGANQAASLEVIKEGGTIASYASAAEMTPTLQFYGFMFKHVTLRMLIRYLFDAETNRAGEAAITRWLEDDALDHAVVSGGGMDDMAAAHQLVEKGEKLGTVVVSL
ncbi:MAG: NADPH:quinone reductase [Pseudomonadota bacterium]